MQQLLWQKTNDWERGGVGGGRSTPPSTTAAVVRRRVRNRSESCGGRIQHEHGAAPSLEVTVKERNAGRGVDVVESAPR